MATMTKEQQRAATIANVKILLANSKDIEAPDDLVNLVVLIAEEAILDYTNHGVKSLMPDALMYYWAQIAYDVLVSDYIKGILLNRISSSDSESGGEDGGELKSIAIESANISFTTSSERASSVTGAASSARLLLETTILPTYYERLNNHRLMYSSNTVNRVLGRKSLKRFR